MARVPYKVEAATGRALPFKGASPQAVTRSGYRIVTSKNFRPTIRRFSYEFKPLAATTLRGLISAAQDMAINEARTQLVSLVYTAPLPPSAFEHGWTPQKYLQVRRIGLVWKAIGKDAVKLGPGGWQGTVFVNRDAFFPAFYYAWVLNFGSDTVGRMRDGHYVARPFWTLMVRTMRLRYLELGRSLAMPALKKDALGRGLEMISNTAFEDVAGTTQPGVVETLANMPN
jgi:hypothetical protein